MPSRSRNVLKLQKRTKVPEKSRERARTQMSPLFNGRPRRLKARRRVKRAISALLGVLALGILVGGMSFVSRVDRLTISELSVNGAETLATSTIAAEIDKGLEGNVWQLFSRRNIFIYPEHEIVANLMETFSEIKTVSISRESLLAQAVTVTIEERSPFALWCNETCFVVDSSGFIYAPAEETAGLLTFEKGLAPGDPIGQTFLRGRLSSVVGILDLLKEAGYAPRGVKVENEHDYIVRIEDGPDLYMSFDTSADDIMRNVQTAFEAEELQEKIHALEYVDLRFGNRVYYKFRDR